jgi:hypothetical protein
MAAAILRTAVALVSEAAVDSEQNEELEARMNAIAPVLSERIRAAVEERPPLVTGGARAKRNLAEHSGFGLGPKVLEGSAIELKRRQRGRRRQQTSCEERLRADRSSEDDQTRGSVSTDVSFVDDGVNLASGSDFVAAKTCNQQCFLPPAAGPLCEQKNYSDHPARSREGDDMEAESAALSKAGITWRHTESFRVALERQTAVDHMIKAMREVAGRLRP